MDFGHVFFSNVLGYIYIYIHIKIDHDDVFFCFFFFGSVGNVWDFFVGGKGWGSVAAGVAQKWGVAKLPANNKGTSLHFPLLQFQCWVGHNLRPNMTISHSESVPGLILILLPWKIDICFCCSNPLKCGCLVPARRPFVLGPFVN